MDASSSTSSDSVRQPFAVSSASASTLRAVAYTVRPSPARRSAVARPIPDEHPVTSTTFDVIRSPRGDATSRPAEVPAQQRGGRRVEPDDLRPFAAGGDQLPADTLRECLSELHSPLV